jgi:DNA helicase-2/ATP-dependent DNA helicase PcrA
MGQLLNLDEYLVAVARAHKGSLPLNDDQRMAVSHNHRTPLWIIAGPGTGKTHTLVWLIMKRVLVDGVAPERIFLTTFTRKAAAELESRVVRARQLLADSGVAAADAIDLTAIHVGTLHGLASRILQDQRDQETLHIRVLEDELTQQFFIRRTRNPLLDVDDLGFWRHFGIAKPNDRYAPAKAGRAENAAKLFNRLTENAIAPDDLAGTGNPLFQRLADAYVRYQHDLHEQHRTDQAHLQSHFLSFLDTPPGRAWLGDDLVVVVDEYQDTNPIQEQIYFRLAKRSSDLTVVGDDDQSLYRFRGTTVESLINFDKACRHYLGKDPTTIYLKENRRSHARLVDFVARFIDNHPEMQDPTVRVRAPSKPALKAGSELKGEYPVIVAIVESTHDAAGRRMGEFVAELKTKGMVEDYSQVAILTFSTKETSHAIGAYARALRELGIPVYNPRNKSAQRDARFGALIGGISSILDPNLDLESLPARLPRGVPEYLQQCRNLFDGLATDRRFAALRAYVDRSAAAVGNARFDPSKRYNYLTRAGGRRVTLSGLFYKLLAHEPFATDLTDPAGGERIRALNLVLSEYEALYDLGELRLARDGATTRIEPWTLYNFCAVFVEGIHDGLNDPEDEDVSIQLGMVNVMTIHQSKGLEFEVVIVVRPDRQPWVSDTHVMEDVFAPFSKGPTKPDHMRSAEMRAAEDTIRLFFVAYSRAKRLLVLDGALTASNAAAWDRPLGFRKGEGRVRNRQALEQLGIRVV